MAAEGFVSFDAKSINEAVGDVAKVRAAIAKEDRTAYREVAQQFTGWARSKATSGTPQEAHFAGALRPSATQKDARVIINGSTQRNAGALGTFFGAKRYRQFPGWVGSSWTPGARGEGPYVLNDTAADHADDMGGIIADARMRAWSNLFNEGGTE